MHEFLQNLFSKFRSSEIVTLPKHEIRANQFVKDVNKLAKKFTNLKIEAENWTDSILDESSEIARFIQEEDGNEEAVDFRNGMNKLDQDSAQETIVNVWMNGNSKDSMQKAYRLIQSLAITKFRAIIHSDSGIKDQTEIITSKGKRLSEITDTERFFVKTFYKFVAEEA